MWIFYVAKALSEPCKVFIVAPRVGKIFRLAGLEKSCIPLDDRIAQIIAS